MTEAEHMGRMELIREVERLRALLAAANWSHREMADDHPDLEPWQREALAWVREREAERDRYREALDSLVEALSAVDVSGQIGDVEDYDEALRSAHEAFAPRRREPSDG